MKPVKTKTSNGVLKAPEGQSEVIDLPITRLQYPNGTLAVESCWELSPKELKRINETGKIYFTCISCTHPPILLSVDPAIEVGD